MSSLRATFNKLGEKTFYVAPAVQEAAVATVILYGQHALRLFS